MLFSAGAAMAQSVVLHPGLSVIVPKTSLGVEPDLVVGTSWHIVQKFMIRDVFGSVECTGVLDQLVVRSAWSHRPYHFYYRIYHLAGRGAINRITSSDFRTLPIKVAFRKDLPGSYSLTRAARNNAGNLVWFSFYQPRSCGGYDDTPFLLIKTSADSIRWGTTEITTTTGNSTLLSTLGP